MSIQRSLAAGLAATFLAAPAMAQKDLAAARLLDAAARASGRVGALVATGTLTPLDALQQIPVAVTVKAAAPGLLRWESPGPDGTVVTVASGTWGWTREGTAWRGLSASEAVLRGAVWFPLALDEWLASPGFKLERPEAAVETGRPVRVVGVVPAGPAEDPDLGQARETIGRIEVVVDPAQGLAVGAHVQDRSGSDWRLARPLRLVFSDFRRVGDGWFPFEITQWSDSSPVLRLRLDSVQTNVSIPASEFLP